MTTQSTASISRLNRTFHATARRGNTLVLVAGILVLLVIIATSYLTTTQSQRSTSVAQQAAAQRDDNSEFIAESIASELAAALFVWQVDLEDPSINWIAGEERFEGVANPNFPRLLPAPDARRYGVDVRELPGASGNFVNATIPYNHAPYHTVPWTNPPDYMENFEFVTNARLWPAGPGNLYFSSNNDQAGDGGGNPAIAALLSAESNPLGNPGFGDNRGLRDTEPVRWDTSEFPGSHQGMAFSHWRKLTNIARANNIWRIAGDISDVDRWIVHDLSIPVEQWPAIRRLGNGFQPPATGDTSFLNVNGGGANLFIRQWRHWFGFLDDNTGNTYDPPIAGYEAAYTNNNQSTPFALPPNLYRLSNLRALNANQHHSQNPWIINGVYQDRPESEFIRGTARHTVGRVLTDTTGDGFTDSFWFVPLTPARNGIRQVVGISIVDNSARLNANVATQFYRSDTGTTNWLRLKTRGQTPADLALVGQRDPNGGADTFNVGFFDNIDNWADPSEYGINYDIHYDVNRWARHLGEVGLPAGIDNLGEIPRLDYWIGSGRLGPVSRPTTAGFLSTGYEPFALHDEIELRMFEGNNNPWIFSRLEWTTHGIEGPMNPSSTGFLRAGAFDQESNEYVHQLNNRELLRDTRRKLTLYSGARNDQLSPGLWWFNRYSIEPTVIQEMAGGATYQRFAARSERKLDLREGQDWFHEYDPVTGEPLYYSLNDSGRLNMSDRLAPTLLLALTDGPDELIDNVAYQSYYGGYTRGTSTADNINDPNTGDTIAVYHEALNGPLNRTRRLAAAYAANILGYRSNEPAELARAVPLPEFGYPGTVDPNHPDAADGILSAENHLPKGRLIASASQTISYLPIDPQPFLVEAFVAHVYRSAVSVPPAYVDPNALDNAGIDPAEFDCDISSLPPGVEFEEYSNAGSPLIFDTEDTRSTIAVVQIANPFDVPIDLYEYRIKLFGNAQLELETVLPAEYRWLEPATDENPRTVIFYAVRDMPGTTDFTAKWMEFLDLDIAQVQAGQPVAEAGNNEKLSPGTLVVNVRSASEGGPVTNGWTVDDRTAYESGDASPPPASAFGLTLSRRDDSLGPTHWIVIDRMDQPSPEAARTFDRAVNYMGRFRPTDRPDPLCSVEPYEDDDNNYPAYTVGSDSDHWIQWVRATRAWGADLNGNGFYENHERNPRYVIGDRTVVVATSNGTPLINNETEARFERPRGSNGEFIINPDVADPDQPPIELMGANYYNFDNEPNGTDPSNPIPWFGRKYYAADGALMDEDPAVVTSTRPARKPTFFDMNWYNDPANTGAANDVRSYPDKGWYGQYSLDQTLFDPSIGIFQIRGIGGSVRLAGGIGFANGVDDPTVLRETSVDIEGTLLNWTGPVTPLFRHGFAMQMGSKNKVIPDDYTPPSGVNEDFLYANKDYEQVGEVLNVWLFGHELSEQSGVYSTRTTFSEFMSGRNAQLNGLPLTFPDDSNAGLANENPYYKWLRRRDGHRVNRLHLKPVEVDGEMISAVLNTPIQPPYNDAVLVGRYSGDPRHAWPAVPAGARVLDLFVCDGPGRLPYLLVNDVTGPDGTPDGQVDEYDLELLSFHNANGFAGRLTPGLININTATPEVMRALPHMTRMVGEVDSDYPLLENPSPRLAEAIVRYRDRVGAPIWDPSIGLPTDIGPAYAHRGRSQGFFADSQNADNENNPFVPGMRGDRGFASIGELGLLTQSGRFGKQFNTSEVDDFTYVSFNANDAFLRIDENSSWRIDYAAMPDREDYRQSWPGQMEPGAPQNPYAYLYRTGTLPTWAPNNIGQAPLSARISTDTVKLFEPDWSNTTGYPIGFHPDITAEDVQEANVLLAGMSNMVSTRSDTFTVHFRIRSFRQNPITGVWDATDPEYIVDDSRYVMLVDRSQVNKPSDKPKILYLEKLPK